MASRCEEVRLAAMALADGSAAALGAAEVESHLHQCPACRAEVESLRALVSLLVRQTRESPSEDLWPGVRAALVKGVAGRRGGRESWVLVVLREHPLRLRVVWHLPEGENV
jgi:anti-sigma factor RsiW